MPFYNAIHAFLRGKTCHFASKKSTFCKLLATNILQNQGLKVQQKAEAAMYDST